MIKYLLFFLLQTSIKSSLLYPLQLVVNMSVETLESTTVNLTTEQPKDNLGIISTSSSSSSDMTKTQL